MELLFRTPCKLSVQVRRRAHVVMNRLGLRVRDSGGRERVGGGWGGIAHVVMHRRGLRVREPGDGEQVGGWGMAYTRTQGQGWILVTRSELLRGEKETPVQMRINSCGGLNPFPRAAAASPY